MDKQFNLVADLDSINLILTALSEVTASWKQVDPVIQSIRSQVITQMQAPATSEDVPVDEQPSTPTE